MYGLVTRKVGASPADGVAPQPLTDQEKAHEVQKKASTTTQKALGSCTTKIQGLVASATMTIEQIKVDPLAAAIVKKLFDNKTSLMEMLDESLRLTAKHGNDVNTETDALETKFMATAASALDDVVLTLKKAKSFK